MWAHLGVKIHALLAVKVDVSSDASAGAREGEEWQRHGDGHVDPDLANVGDYIGGYTGAI